MKRRHFKVVFEKSETGYGAYIPKLPGCVAVGRTKREVEKLIQKAIEMHLRDPRNRYAVAI